MTEETPPSPENELEMVEKEKVEKEILELLNKFNLCPETDTEINYKTIKKWAIIQLIRLIEMGNSKVYNYCRPKNDKLQWGRLISYNIQVLNTLLRDEELNEIKKRMELFENGFIKNRQ